MNRANTFIHRQGELLLNKPPFAYAMVFLFAGLPFLTWLSVAIVAFLTLRLGPLPGIKALLVGVCSVLFANYLVGSASPMILGTLFLTFFPPYFAAWILRLTASWHVSAIFLLLLATLIILYIYFFLPNFLQAEYDALLKVLQEFKKNGVQLKDWLENKEHILNYILGIQAVFFLLSSISSLMIARAFQSKLFYPAGFKQEMLSFRASPLLLLPFVLLFIGFYYHYPLSLSLLPVWLLYFCAAGLSVIIYFFAEHRALLVFSLLLISISIFPLVFIPFIVSVGTLDALFNFRQRFNKSKTDQNSP